MKGTQQPDSIRVFHPLLFAVYPALFVYSQNLRIVAFKDFLVFSLVSFIAGLLLWRLLRLWLPDPKKSALICSYLLIAFFFFGHLTNYIAELTLASETHLHGLMQRRLSLQVPLTVLLIAAPLLIAYFARAKEHLIEAATAVLNCAAVVLVLFGAITSALALGGGDSTAMAHYASDQRPNCPPVENRPDIYHIILDGYGRHDVLEKYFQHDNSEFLSGLEEKGFQVSSASTANYYWTVLSLASTLNMEYFDPAQSLGFESVTRLIRDNRLSRTLKACGYQYLHIASTYTATARNEFADQQFGRLNWLNNEYFHTLLESTWLSVFERFLMRDLAESHLQSFAALGNLASLKGPKYVFAHIVLPHHPYLFDRNGNILRRATVVNQFEFEKKLWNDKEAYIEQTLFVEKITLQTIDKILAGSPRPPIIVIHSDHGPHISKVPMPLARHARFSNLAALMLPGKPRDLIPPNVTMVNMFRLISNFYFATSYPMLGAEHYYSPFKDRFALSKIDFNPNTVRCDSTDAKSKCHKY